MTLDRRTLRGLIADLESRHGEERGVWPRERFTFVVRFDDGTEYQFRWPRSVRAPAWEVTRCQ